MPQNPLTIGGQAVIEGVMMRGPHGYAIACRRADGTIRTEVTPHRPLIVRRKWLNLPVVRGAVGLVEMLTIGMKSLEFSAQEAERGERDREAALAGTASAETPEEKPLSRVALAATMALSLAIGITMFVVIPNIATHFAAVIAGAGDKPLLEEQRPVLYNLISGFIRLLIVVGYIWAISLMKDVRRLFQYHGAEHKAVSCFEAGRDLSVREVQKFSTLHPRCGTTFIAITLMVAIVVFAVFAKVLLFFWPGFAELAFAARKAILIFGHVAIMPVVAGVCFEILRLGGRHRNNPLLQIFLQPGYWFQRLTTREPDDSMVEVAVNALQSALAIPAVDAVPEASRVQVAEAAAAA